LHLILGGAALQRCDNFALIAALAAEVDRFLIASDFFRSLLRADQEISRKPLISELVIVKSFVMNILRKMHQK
jgi:hypothetical protein